MYFFYPGSFSIARERSDWAVIRDAKMRVEEANTYEKQEVKGC